MQEEALKSLWVWCQRTLMYRIYLSLCRKKKYILDKNIKETIIENGIVYLLFCLLSAESCAFKCYFLCKQRVVDTVLINVYIYLHNFETDR